MIQEIWHCSLHTNHLKTLLVHAFFIVLHFILYHYYSTYFLIIVFMFQEDLIMDAMKKLWLPYVFRTGPVRHEGDCLGVRVWKNCANKKH